MLDKRLLSFAVIGGAGVLAVALAVAGYLRSNSDSEALPPRIAEEIVEPAAVQPKASERGSNRSTLADAIAESAIEIDAEEKEGAAPESPPATTTFRGDRGTGPELAAKQTETVPDEQDKEPPESAESLVGVADGMRARSLADVAEAPAAAGPIERRSQEVLDKAEAAPGASPTHPATELLSVTKEPGITASRGSVVDRSAPAGSVEHRQEDVVVAPPAADNATASLEDVTASSAPDPGATSPPVAIEEVEGSATEPPDEEGAAAPTVVIQAPKADSLDREPASAKRAEDLLAAAKGQGAEIAAPDPGATPLDVELGESAIGETNADTILFPAGNVDVSPFDPRSELSSVAVRSRPQPMAHETSKQAAAGADRSSPASNQSTASSDVIENVERVKDALRPEPARQAPALDRTATTVANVTPPAEGDASVDLPSQQAREVAQVHFDTNSSYLSPGARIMVGRAIEALSGIEGGFQVEVIGFTDRVGPVGYNMWLADRRVQRVIDALAEAGLPRESLSGIARGPFQLPVPTDDGVSEPLNRCVSVSVVEAK